MKKLCTIFTAVLLLCGGMNVLAQSNKFTNGTEGTDFWFSFPVSYNVGGGSNSLRVYVSSEVATQCTLEIPGMGYKVAKMTRPNDVIEFVLSPGLGQPYEKGEQPGTGKSEEEIYTSGKGRGVHVYADVPLTVYAVSRFLATSDSFIALPVSSLGTEYIVASMPDMTGGGPFSSLYLPSQTVVVAAYDSTMVSFTLGGSTGTETVGGLKRGETKTFVLNKGDLLAFANKKVNGFYADISGSRIVATKPVAVISGNQCAYVPETTQACDFIMEMELPTNTWGQEYHVPHTHGRKNFSWIKVFAKNPNTNLYRDGNPVSFATLTTAGGNKGAGYYEGRVLEDGSGPHPVVIKADGPISITQYNPGQVDDGVNGDPFQLVLTPIEQYQTEITFNTPGIKGGYGFKENYVNLVFEGNSSNQVPDDIEFGVAENDTVIWYSLKSKFGSSAEPFKQFATDAKKIFSKDYYSFRRWCL